MNMRYAFAESIAAAFLLPAATIQIVPDTGHLALVERPRVVLDFVFPP